MKNYSGRRTFVRLAAIACLCLGGAPISGWAQDRMPHADYAGAVTSDIMSMAAMGNSPAGLPPGPAVNGMDTAVTAAVADGITTGIGLSAGAVEMNPLISPTPLGVLAMTGLKVGLMKYAETLPEADKRMTLKTGASVWSGAAINNLLVLAAAPTPLSIVAGIIVGIATWMHMDSEYQEQDRLAALRATPPLPVALAPTAVPVAQNDGSSVVTAEATGEMSSGE
jgi:hypothetical protein